MPHLRVCVCVYMYVDMYADVVRIEVELQIVLCTYKQKVRTDVNIPEGNCRHMRNFSFFF